MTHCDRCAQRHDIERRAIACASNGTNQFNVCGLCCQPARDAGYKLRWLPGAWLDLGGEYWRGCQIAPLKGERDGP